MFKSYFKIAWRNLLKNKTSSFINIGGLAAGMAVAMLIGLWIYDEFNFNKIHENYPPIAKIMERGAWNGKISTGRYMPIPLGQELKKSYSDDFDNVVISTFTEDHILANGDAKFTKNGNYMQPEGPDLFSLHMLEGSRGGLKELNSLFLSASSAKALFGHADPLNKVVRIDNRQDVKVTGVYEDFPKNSEFNEVTFIAPWDLYIASNDWLKKFTTSWTDNMIQIFVNLAPNANFGMVSNKIINTLQDKVDEKQKIHHKEVFLHPMSKWHLYEEFKDGKNTGGRIQFVWLFGIIGVFVLLLACINFMNLSTAHSEKRAKEVGIRKAIGSLRRQLIGQFFVESILVAALAFVLSVILVISILPWFNRVADKQIAFLWANPLFWASGIGFTLITGMIAGSYPALYLSSFRAIRVLKGTFRTGRLASLPRKVLVVLQFSVSVALIIGTIVVYKQIQYTRDRQVGYSRNGLISIYTKSDEIHRNFDAIRNELKASGAIDDLAESSSAVTQYYMASFGGFDWKGKDPNLSDNFGITWMTPEFGRTVGWQFIDGRDFSRGNPADQLGFVINEAAEKYMGFKHATGEIVKWDHRNWTILGVVKDMIVESPYEKVRPSIYMPFAWQGNVVSIKINPAQSAQAALKKIGSVLKAYAPGTPFDYKFADEQYARKFENEARIGTLSAFFALLAILISCLGLFGLSSFVAEQRNKEIGVRKVLGATVFNLWKMLSKDFALLVIISLFISAPPAYYFMHHWLENYQYRTNISWWIFALTGFSALGIALLTVSFRAVRAAMANPVRSLRAE